MSFHEALVQLLIIVMPCIILTLINRKSVH